MTEKDVVSENVFLNKFKTLRISRISVTHTGTQRSQKRCISSNGTDLNLNVNKCLITVKVCASLNNATVFSKMK